MNPPKVLEVEQVALSICERSSWRILGTTNKPREKTGADMSCKPVNADSLDINYDDLYCNFGTQIVLVRYLAAVGKRTAKVNLSHVRQRC